MNEVTLVNEILITMPTLAPMLLLVWWLKGGNDKMVSQLTEERRDRLDGMEHQITSLEKRSESCEQDRIVLHRENAAMKEQMDQLRASKNAKRGSIPA